MIKTDAFNLVISEKKPVAERFLLQKSIIHLGAVFVKEGFL